MHMLNIYYQFFTFTHSAMVVTVLQGNEVTPPQLSTMVVTVLQGNEVTAPQLSTIEVTVL